MLSMLYVLMLRATLKTWEWPGDGFFLKFVLIQVGTF